LFKADEQVSKSGLYRCTTCGLMIPVNPGERLPACPNRCADAIWTFFNQSWDSPPGEVREASETFRAHDLDGEPRQIPAGARLTGIHFGPDLPDTGHANPKLAAFHFEGQVYFGSAAELFRKTTVIP